LLHDRIDVESGSNIVETEMVSTRYRLMILCIINLKDPERAVSRVLAEVVMWRCNKVRDGLVLKFEDSGESDPWRDITESDAAVGNGS
jgi:hypothetical protein